MKYNANGVAITSSPNIIKSPWCISEDDTERTLSRNGNVNGRENRTPEKIVERTNENENAEFSV